MGAQVIELGDDRTPTIHKANESVRVADLEPLRRTLPPHAPACCSPPRGEVKSRADAAGGLTIPAAVIRTL
jgi:hypothetical protein